MRLNRALPIPSGDVTQEFHVRSDVEISGYLLQKASTFIQMAC